MAYKSLSNNNLSNGNKKMSVGEKFINEKGNARQCQDAWEQKIPMSEVGTGDDPAGAFLPRPGKERARPYTKINECDH